jgi:flavin reductase (DIM6/NTAB) family NADH-FMN oxidoreductase RutF
MDADQLQQDLKLALRRLAKAVVVITTRHDGVRHAMAATAVSELSMDPPSLLICVNRTASMHPALAAGADFCINILHSAHEEIAAACSGKLKREARFEVGAWAEAEALPIPRLAGAQASFVCAQDGRFDHGTHSIFIGRVVEVVTDGAVDPLVYVDGRYTVVAPGEDQGGDIRPA